jgi:hypothetical protein
VVACATALEVASQEPARAKNERLSPREAICKPLALFNVPLTWLAPELAPPPPPPPPQASANAATEKPLPQSHKKRFIVVFMKLAFFYPQTELRNFSD